MGDVNVPPSEGSAYRRTARRLENVERGTRKAKRSKVEETPPWSLNGAVAVTTAGDEPLWRARTGGQIIAATMHLNTAGSSSTVGTFYLNGASIGTITLASSATDVEAYLGSHRVKPGDRIGFRITTAGTGARGLSAFLTMKG
jgi:hypothetical protein